MQTIRIDGSEWTTPLEFYDALLQALGQYEGHGRGVAAFIGSMIYGGMLQTEPPYEVLVENVTSDLVQAEVDVLSRALAEARNDRRVRCGDDVEVTLRRVTS
ncbi:hypothetical protein [Phenylobacterium aquaticum]|uniref:hypothetical protein n=1 Tax=Phenylobacterium aquaticum TaxID=1763816 RepID=UPI0026EAC6B2|nr:hypothetical protein [Phenylobacterium aquaticum]